MVEQAYQVGQHHLTEAECRGRGRQEGITIAAAPERVFQLRTGDSSAAAGLQPVSMLEVGAAAGTNTNSSGSQAGPAAHGSDKPSSAASNNLPPSSAAGATQTTLQKAVQQLAAAALQLQAIVPKKGGAARDSVAQRTAAVVQRLTAKAQPAAAVAAVPEPAAAGNPKAASLPQQQQNQQPPAAVGTKSDQSFAAPTAKVFRRSLGAGQSQAATAITRSSVPAAAAPKQKARVVHQKPAAAPAATPSDTVAFLHLGVLQPTPESTAAIRDTEVRDRSEVKPLAQAAEGTSCPTPPPLQSPRDGADYSSPHSTYSGASQSCYDDSPASGGGPKIRAFHEGSIRWSKAEQHQRRSRKSRQSTQSSRRPQTAAAAHSLSAAGRPEGKAAPNAGTADVVSSNSIDQAKRSAPGGARTHRADASLPPGKTALVEGALSNLQSRLDGLQGFFSRHMSTIDHFQMAKSLFATPQDAAHDRDLATGGNTAATGRTPASGLQQYSSSFGSTVVMRSASCSGGAGDEVARSFDASNPGEDQEVSSAVRPQQHQQREGLEAAEPQIAQHACGDQDNAAMVAQVLAMSDAELSSSLQEVQQLSAGAVPLPDGTSPYKSFIEVAQLEQNKRAVLRHDASRSKQQLGASRRSRASALDTVRSSSSQSSNASAAAAAAGWSFHVSQPATFAGHPLPPLQDSDGCKLAEEYHRQSSLRHRTAPPAAASTRRSAAAGQASKPAQRLQSGTNRSIAAAGPSGRSSAEKTGVLLAAVAHQLSPGHRSPDAALQHDSYSQDESQAGQPQRVKQLAEEEASPAAAAAAHSLDEPSDVGQPEWADQLDQASEHPEAGFDQAIHNPEGGSQYQTPPPAWVSQPRHANAEHGSPGVAMQMADNEDGELATGQWGVARQASNGGSLSEGAEGNDKASVSSDQQADCADDLDAGHGAAKFKFEHIDSAEGAAAVDGQQSGADEQDDGHLDQVPAPDQQTPAAAPPSPSYDAAETPLVRTKRDSMAWDQWLAEFNKTSSPMPPARMTVERASPVADAEAQVTPAPAQPPQHQQSDRSSTAAMQELLAAAASGSHSPDHLSTILQNLHDSLTAEEDAQGDEQAMHTSEGHQQASTSSPVHVGSQPQREQPHTFLSPVLPECSSGSKQTCSIPPAMPGGDSPTPGGAARPDESPMPFGIRDDTAKQHTLSPTALVNKESVHDYEEREYPADAFEWSDVTKTPARMALLADASSLPAAAAAHGRTPEASHTPRTAAPSPRPQHYPSPQPPQPQAPAPAQHQQPAQTPPHVQQPQAQQQQQPPQLQRHQAVHMRPLHSQQQQQQPLHSHNQQQQPHYTAAAPRTAGRLVSYPDSKPAPPGDFDFQPLTNWRHPARAGLHGNSLLNETLPMGVNLEEALLRAESSHASLASAPASVPASRQPSGGGYEAPASRQPSGGGGYEVPASRRTSGGGAGVYDAPLSRQTSSTYLGGAAPSRGYGPSAATSAASSRRSSLSDGWDGNTMPLTQGTPALTRRRPEGDNCQQTPAAPPAAVPRLISGPRAPKVRVLGHSLQMLTPVHEAPGALGSGVLLGSYFLLYHLNTFY